MAKEIRVTEHYSASIANNIAEGARVLGALRDVGLNLIAFWGYKHGEGGQPHFCCGPQSKPSSGWAKHGADAKSFQSMRASGATRILVHP